MTSAYTAVWKDFVEALPRNKGKKEKYGRWINKRYCNVPLSQATKKKSKITRNEDNLSMCVFSIMLSYFKRHSKPAFSRLLIPTLESLHLSIPPSLMAL